MSNGNVLLRNIDPIKFFFNKPRGATYVPHGDRSSNESADLKSGHSYKSSLPGGNFRKKTTTPENFLYI